MRRHGSRESGNVAFLVIVALIIVGAGYFVWDSRAHMESDAHRFAHEVIERVAVQHDAAYLHSIIAAAARINFPSGVEADEMRYFVGFGKAEPTFNVTGKVEYDDYFYKPHGRMQSILTYPDRHATISVDVLQVEGRWRIKGLYLTWEKPPES